MLRDAIVKDCPFSIKPVIWLEDRRTIGGISVDWIERYYAWFLPLPKETVKKLQSFEE
jgi:hypothetical protein